MRKYIALPLIVIALLLFGCESQRGQIMDGDGMFQIDPDEDTMKFDESITEGGVGEFIPESENDEIGVIMEVSNVSASGLTVRLRRYDKRDTGELIYGSGYSLKRLNGDVWEDVPPIIDNGVFTDEGYIIPEEGEAVMKTDWEWLYGKLTPGTYRITKVVIDSDKDGPGVNASSYPLTAQFVLAGE